MNKKLILIGLVIALVALTACQKQGVVENTITKEGMLKAIQDTNSHLDSLPAGFTIPEVLPAAIQDSVLMQGWIYLYNLKEPVQLWDGSTLTGQTLAQYILDNRIPVLWGSANICNGNSCATLPGCPDAGCNPGDNRQGRIYIAAWIEGKADSRIQTIAESLAHETFHATRPFGSKDTQFEEYWAFYVGAKIAKTTWAHFHGYDPLDPACLTRWFTHYEMENYLALDPYPQEGMASVQSSVEECPCAIDTNLPDSAIVDGGSCKKTAASSNP